MFASRDISRARSRPSPQRRIAHLPWSFRSFNLTFLLLFRYAIARSPLDTLSF